MSERKIQAIENARAQVHAWKPSDVIESYLQQPVAARIMAERIAADVHTPAMLLSLLLWRAQEILVSKLVECNRWSNDDDEPDSVDLELFVRRDRMYTEILTKLAGSNPLAIATEDAVDYGLTGLYANATSAKTQSVWKWVREALKVAHVPVPPLPGYETFVARATMNH